MEEFFEIKNLIKKCRSILLCVNPEKTTSFDLNLSSSVLFYTLKKIGKVVKFYPNDFPFNNPFFSFPLKDLKPILFVSKDSDVLSEIYYKKEGDLIELCFLSKSISFNLNKMSLEEFKNKPDVIVTLGVPSLEILGDFYERNFKLFFSLPIINIDNNPANREYGKINFIEETPFSFLISKVLLAISKKAIDQHCAKSLFYGILYSLKQKKLERKTMELLIFLKERTSEFLEVSKHLLKEFSEKERRLFEVFVKSLEYNREVSLPIITISKKELSSSLLKEVDLPKGISLFRGKIWTISPILFLWESHASNQGILYSPFPEHLKKLSLVFDGVAKEGRVFFTSKRSCQITKSLILKTLYG